MNVETGGGSNRLTDTSSAPAGELVVDVAKAAKDSKATKKKETSQWKLVSSDLANDDGAGAVEKRTDGKARKGRESGNKTVDDDSPTDLFDAPVIGSRAPKADAPSAAAITGTNVSTGIDPPADVDSAAAAGSSVLLGVNVPGADEPDVEVGKARRRPLTIIAGLVFVAALVGIGVYLLQTGSGLNDRSPSADERLDDSASTEPVEDGSDNFGVSAVGVEGDDREGSSGLFEGKVTETTVSSAQATDAESTGDEAAAAVVLGTPTNELEDQPELQPTTTIDSDIADYIPSVLAPTTVPTLSTIINTTVGPITTSAPATTTTEATPDGSATTLPTSETTESSTSSSEAPTTTTTSTTTTESETTETTEETTTTTTTLPPVEELGNIDVTSAGLLLMLRTVPEGTDQICWTVGLASGEIIDSECTTNIGDPLVIASDRLVLGPAQLTAHVYSGDDTLFTFRGSGMFWSGDVLDEPETLISGDELILRSHARPEITRYCWELSQAGATSTDWCSSDPVQVVPLQGLFDNFATGEIVVTSTVEIDEPLGNSRDAGREESQLTIGFIDEGDGPDDEDGEPRDDGNNREIPDDDDEGQENNGGPPTN